MSCPDPEQPSPLDYDTEKEETEQDAVSPPLNQRISPLGKRRTPEATATACSFDSVELIKRNHGSSMTHQNPSELDSNLEILRKRSIVTLERINSTAGRQYRRDPSPGCFSLDESGFSSAMLTSSSLSESPQNTKTDVEGLSPLGCSTTPPGCILSRRASGKHFERWKHLLSKDRISGRNRSSSHSTPASGMRTDFLKDFDKIIFSTSFRRMKDKTQVFPLPHDDTIHNRLIHSLECASVGRSLGRKVGYELYCRGDTNANSISDFGDVVAASCLIHDIGNPPFGHCGEAALRRWWSLWKEKNQQMDAVQRMPDHLEKDLSNFEGNAGGFRLLTKVKDFGLTAAVLASYMKYPCTASSRCLTSFKKNGIYCSEIKIFEEVALSCHLPPLHHHHDENKKGTVDQHCKAWLRHPLVYLVEAADDICYTIMDAEDGWRLSLLSEDELCDALVKVIQNGSRHSLSPLQISPQQSYSSTDPQSSSPLAPSPSQSSSLASTTPMGQGPQNPILVGTIASFSPAERGSHTIPSSPLFNSPTRLFLSEHFVAGSNKQSISKLRGLAINAAIDEVCRMFILHYDDIMDGKVILGGLANEILRPLEGTKKIYRSSMVYKIETASFTVIQGLMDFFVDALVAEFIRSEAGSFERHILAMFPPSFMNLISSANDLLKSDPPQLLYELILLMADYVFSMTDSFAVQTYKELTGQALPCFQIK